MAKLKSPAKKLKKAGKSSPEEPTANASSSLSLPHHNQKLHTEEKQSIYHLTRTFHPFPRLPVDLRLVIWSICLPGPRILQVLSPTCSCTSITCMRAHRFRTRSPLPTLLHVNQESRAEVLRRYILIEAEWGFYLAFDTRIDTLSFDGGMEWPYLLVGDEECKRDEYKIRRLAIGEIDLRWDNFPKSIDEYLQFDEITILLSSWRSHVEDGVEKSYGSTLVKEKAVIRVLEVGEDIEKYDRWGDWCLKTKLIEFFAEIRHKGSKTPVVRLAQWECMTVDDDFCYRAPKRSVDASCGSGGYVTEYPFRTRY